VETLEEEARRKETDDVRKIIAETKRLRKTPAAELADDSEYTEEVIMGFTQQSFNMRGRTIKRLKYPKNKYKSKKKKYVNQATKKLRKELNKAIGEEPTRELVQKVAALILLKNLEVVPGKQEDYWNVTRNGAYQLDEHGEDADKVAQVIKEEIGDDFGEYSRILYRVVTEP